LKDQITYLPDNADRSVAKQKFKITNWPTYNKALINPVFFKIVVTLCLNIKLHLLRLLLVPYLG
jgi:hypothetical protein